MEQSTLCYSLKIPIRIATTCVRRTRHPVQVNSLSASIPSALSPVSIPMPFPLLQLAALSASHQHSDGMRIPSAPGPAGPAGPAAAPHLHKALCPLNLQVSASHQLWEAVAAHLANHHRSAEEMPLASPQPLEVAASSANHLVSDSPQEVASARPQHWASQPVPSVLPVLVSLPSPPNLLRLAVLVSLRS